MLRLAAEAVGWEGVEKPVVELKSTGQQRDLVGVARVAKVVAIETGWERSGWSISRSDVSL